MMHHHALVASNGVCFGGLPIDQPAKSWTWACLPRVVVLSGGWTTLITYRGKLSWSGGSGKPRRTPKRTPRTLDPLKRRQRTDP